jgi:outer membrane protein assembly factor BamB
MSRLIQSRPALVIAAAGAALAGLLAVTGTAGAVERASAHAGIASAHRHTASTTFYNWPMFRAVSTHYGVSPETAINTTTAPSLTQKWAVSLGTTSYTSPAVVKALVYAGANSRFYAYPAGGGAAVWSYKIATGVVETSPAVFNGVVYFGTTTGTMYALNASTGALLCSFNTGATILASPVVVSAPDGSGPVMYDGTIPGTGPGAEWAIYGPGNKHGACTKDWEFTAFAVSPGGSWSSPAYGTNADGIPVLVFGSKDRDDSVYALNANTGALVWRYQTSTQQYLDVGAPPTISPPGRNGFADGVVYVTGKDKVLYALNLTTGSLIWKYALAAGSHGDVSGTALLGNHVYLGSDTGVYALNAVTGALVWHVLSTSTFYGSPAITGPSGQQVLLLGDTAGNLYALNLATGATVWAKKPNSGFWASPAVSQGAFYVAGLDGVLRSYAPNSQGADPPNHAYPHEQKGH